VFFEDAFDGVEPIRVSGVRHIVHRYGLAKGHDPLKHSVRFLRSEAIAKINLVYLLVSSSVEKVWVDRLVGRP
jgi:hypothetical protein